jgi:O-acetylserine/cysteine efflux transporter
LCCFQQSCSFPRPKAAWANLAAYGALIGGGQFGLLYVAMRGHITPGLASLVVQCQVFFTIGLSIWKNGERVATGQWLAIALATLGLVTIAVYGGGDATPLELSLVVLAGFCWACANIIAKGSPGANMLGYVVWASIFALLPLFVLSVAFEGSDAAFHALKSATPWAWTALFWQSVDNTLFGYAAWGWLLARHPAVYVTPTALLVPAFGMGASSLLLAEPLQPWKIAAGSLIIAGLCINLALSRAPARS